MKRRVFAAKTRLLMRADRAAFADMLRAEREPLEHARERSASRSAALAAFAYEQSDFYREHYRAAGFAAADVARPENFTLLPAVTKDHIHEHGERLAAQNVPDARRLASKTGGSTGRPLLVYNDDAAPVAALWWRIYSWWGIHPADDSAYIYRRARTGLARIAHDLQWWPSRQILLDARGTTRAATADFVAQAQRIRPALLVGYVEAVRAFAEYVHEEGVSLPSLRAISVTASVLQPGQRQFIQEALGAPVYDTYRSAEVPWIAAECAQRDGLHVLSDRRRVDVVDAAGIPTTDVGDILVTDLDNRAYPLIRYAIGDRTQALPSGCACGRTLERIAPIDGRIADALRTPSGRSVSGGFGGLFNEWRGVVRQFQLHQGPDDTVTIRFVPESDASAATRAAEAVAQTLRTMLHDEVPVRVRVVDAVEAVGGKARLVIAEPRA